MTEREKQVFDALSAQCAKREYCTADVRRKARYAAAYAREKSALAGWGPVKIRTTLLARGVPRDVAVEALGEIDADRAAAKLEKVLEAKWRTLQDDPQGRLKLIRFALSRGYDYDPLRPLIDRLTHPQQD